MRKLRREEREEENDAIIPQSQEQRHILKKNNWSSIDMMTLSDFAWTGRMKVLRVPGTLSIAFYHACFFRDSNLQCKRA